MGERLIIMTKRFTLYYRFYNDKFTEWRLLCWSEDEETVLDYLEQISLVDYKLGRQVEYLRGVCFTDETRDYYELVSLCESIIMSRLEYAFYYPTFMNLYNDMKTTISSLLMYNKLLGLKPNIVSNDEIKQLYNNCKDFNTFMNSLDKDTLFNTYISHPVSIMGTLIDNYTMNQDFRNTISTVYPDTLD